MMRPETLALLMGRSRLIQANLNLYAQRMFRSTVTWRALIPTSVIALKQTKGVCPVIPRVSFSPKYSSIPEGKWS